MENWALIVHIGDWSWGTLKKLEFTKSTKMNQGEVCVWGAACNANIVEAKAERWLVSSGPAWVTQWDLWKPRKLGKQQTNPQKQNTASEKQ